MISPLLFLLVLCGLTVGAGVLAARLRERRAGRLETLARSWQMRFAPEDRFGLAAPVAGLLPVPGAADVVVRDVAYTEDAGAYRYLFTVEYTVGVLRAKHRRVSAAFVTEARECGAATPYSAVTLAEGGRPVEEQYELLHGRFFTA